MGVAYSSHGVDAVDVVVGPAGGQLVGVLLLLWSTETQRSVLDDVTRIVPLQNVY